MTGDENSDYNRRKNVHNSFDELAKHDSTPSIPLTDVQKVRFLALANDLRQAEIQAYIETNFGTQALNLLQAVVPMIAGLI